MARFNPLSGTAVVGRWSCLCGFSRCPLEQSTHNLPSAAERPSPKNPWKYLRRFAFFSKETLAFSKETSRIDAEEPAAFLQLELGAG